MLAVFNFSHCVENVPVFSPIVDIVFFCFFVPITAKFDIPATKAWYSRLDRAPLKITPITAGEPALVAGYYHTEKGGLKEAYFEQGDIAFDVNNNPEGTTLWHLVREGKRDD